MREGAHLPAGLRARADDQAACGHLHAPDSMLPGQDGAAGFAERELRALDHRERASVALRRTGHRRSRWWAGPWRTRSRGTPTPAWRRNRRRSAMRARPGSVRRRQGRHPRGTAATAPLIDPGAVAFAQRPREGLPVECGREVGIVEKNHVGSSQVCGKLGPDDAAEHVDRAVSQTALWHCTLGRSGAGSDRPSTARARGVKQGRRSVTDFRDDPHLKVLATELAEKKIDRREFVRFATLLGASAAAAYGMAGKITGEPFAPAARAQRLAEGRRHPHRQPHQGDQEPAHLFVGRLRFQHVAPGRRIPDLHGREGRHASPTCSRAGPSRRT